MAKDDASCNRRAPVRFSAGRILDEAEREREQGKKGTRERGAFIEEIRFSPFEEFGRIKIRPEKRLWRMKSKHEEMEEDLNASRALCRQF